MKKGRQDRIAETLTYADAGSGYKTESESCAKI